MGPMVAAGALGVVAAVAVRDARAITMPVTDRAPEFVGNCDRRDIEAIERWRADDRTHIYFCTPTHHGPQAAYLTLWSPADSAVEVHLLGPGLQDLAAPIFAPVGTICEPQPRIVELGGGDELLLWSPTLDAMVMWSGTPPDQSTACARLIADRDGKLVMSKERRYARTSDPQRAARDLFDHEPLTAEK